MVTVGVSMLLIMVGVIPLSIRVATSGVVPILITVKVGCPLLITVQLSNY